jgi:uncharacterized protein (TIGR01319 family)
MPRHLIVDVGSTTTKAILFTRGEEGWHFVRREAPTTVEAPHADVAVGLMRALGDLQEATGVTLVEGGRPTLPLLLTSSAGGGLAMVVTGLVKKVTSRSAERAALGAGAMLLDTIALDDGRVPYRKIEALRTLRPDMVLFAGGFDGEALSGPVFLAEMLRQADLRSKLSETVRLPVVYAGNVNATDLVAQTLDDRYLLVPVPNLRPDGDLENLEPARSAIHDLFMDHVMSHAPGYAALGDWVGAPILPTPSGVAKILELVTAATDQKMLVIDVGGATTDVFTAQGGKVFRTVSANLGMSYSALNVAVTAGIGAITALLDGEFTDKEAWNRILNKHIDPTSLPTTEEDVRLERALAAVAIREAVREHLEVMSGGPLSLGEDDLSLRTIGRRRKKKKKKQKGPRLDVSGYDLIVGSGGILSHSPRAATARMLVDAVSPKPRTKLAADSAFMFPQLGVLSEQDPTLAVDLFNSLGLVMLERGGDAPALPPPARESVAGTATLTEGPISVRRELAAEGEVLVAVGDSVHPETIVGRCTRKFLRPFFLPVASALEVEPEELTEYLLKGVGEDIDIGELLARRSIGLFREKVYHAPVAGTIRRILPNGTLVVREKEERVEVLRAVQVAKELEVEARRLTPYIKVQVDQEVERGQALAMRFTSKGVISCPSPFRGRVERIDRDFGIMLIAPIQEELDVSAWCPGEVASVDPRGVTITAMASVVTGVWGQGGEAVGDLHWKSIKPGGISVLSRTGPEDLSELVSGGVAGLVTGSLDFADILDRPPTFPIVLTEGFGRREMRSCLETTFRAHGGRLAVMDGTTELRVGVRRPRVILPL